MQSTDKTMQETKYNTQQAAELLGLKSYRSVSRLCHLGQIPGAYRVGSRWRIPQSAIDAVLAQR